MFEAILVSVILGQDGKPIENHWAAFPLMNECKLIAESMTNYLASHKRQGDDAFVFRSKCTG